MMVDIKPKKQPKQYSCESCEFYTYNKKDFNRHLSTRKHLIKINVKEGDHNEKKIGFTCENCNKFYKYISGLSRHKQNCKSTKQIKSEKQIEMDLIIEQTNNLMKESQDLMKKIVESVPKINNADISPDINTINLYLFINKRKTSTEDSKIDV
jgi:CRISPR/Cas system CSM-associated protein Csm2 small subunit